ncbi:MAG TPA: chemotaxis protein CheA [Syntrophorhabdaceae bacterium]|nr:chemotaxis protein CheA [Syntrophorhabdaceae bacterium]HPC67039.1 chemotaxis protein CheA [Syntrophorhabdaceae bacterium]HQE79878.1 chemotaxis protein CheA [Syntrophorhabdaceae bacterium]HQH42269.1 chemotaxis protein CheA [Syntrophorhabdaceae bacterium]HQK45581.1 chemotaxis protein CheA [Syntrophorhabdaceae bacterium]
MSNQALENEEMREIINDFIVETSELIENVIQDIVAIEGVQDDETINGIFRAVHTIKGTSSFLEFHILSQLAHKAEDLLGMIRKGEIKINKEIADALLEAMDIMRFLVEDIKTDYKEKQDTSAILDKLERLSNPDKKMLGEILVEEKILTKKELEGVLEKQKEQNKKLGEIIVEEKLITENQLENILTKQKTKKDDQTVRIDVKKLDEMMNLVGELVLGKNRLNMVKNTVKRDINKNSTIDSLEEVTNYIEVITNELQLSIMKARLVPLSKLFNKVPRLVRDLSNSFNKEIDLKITGEETELDRSLIESLHDPLIHIIRNSVDHGVETKEERVKKNKPERGTISINAYNEGNNVVIDIIDDGKGIDLDSLKKKVLEKGLMSEAEINDMSEKDIMNLIFIPGLSTAKKISNVSGRGVGMDVVKTNIERMNGQVYIDSKKNQWTKISIKLPLTLAIMGALIVEIARELYAIPLNNVIELVKLKKEAIKTVDKNEVLMLRNEIVPILDVSKIMSLKEKGLDRYIVICKIGDKTLGVKVNSVVGQEEIVIKPLGEFMGNIKGIGGASIRGDGKVILILDIPAMMSSRYMEKINKRREEVQEYRYAV